MLIFGHFGTWKYAIYTSSFKTRGISRILTEIRNFLRRTSLNRLNHQKSRFFFEFLKKGFYCHPYQFLKYTPRNIPSGVKKSKKFGNIGLGNQIRGPKNVEKRDFCLLVIFGIFDPFQKAQKWKLGQFLVYAFKNIPSGVRKSRKFGNIALGNQIACPKNVEKT